jgi:hypothetical protein
MGVLKTPKEKAEELISDFIEMMPDGIDKIGHNFQTQYHVAKCQAEYCAHTAKFSHKPQSKKFKFWENVTKEVRNL